MSKEWLANDVPPETLDRIYGPEDYYGYLKSEPFVNKFLLPIADLTNGYGSPVLDVGCGEGWLSIYTRYDSHYTGVDGSGKAIAAARAYHSRDTARFYVARLEEPGSIPGGPYPTVVFGSILETLIRPQYRYAVLEEYRRKFGVKRFIVYDLYRLDTTELERCYAMTYYYGNTVTRSEMPDLQDAKRYRKVMVFDTKRF